jgi:pimeloyl-ACP methyl ester carboxylesterase
MGANHRNQDLHPDHSLARHLAALARDVWLLTLRTGRGARSWADRGRMRFDAMVEHDVPTAVRGVLERAGAARLDYVGFSMGGMLLYAALGRTVPEASLRRAVIVGSPGDVRLAWPLRALLRVVPRALIPTFHLRLGARAFAFASEWVATPLHEISANPKNIAPGITRAAMVNLVEDVPGPLNQDFAAFALAGGELRARGEPVLAGLADVAVPALFVAGTADKLAPIPSVRRAFDAWAAHRPSTPKGFVVAGRAHGHREDYGHGDMAIGANVVAEVFAPIARFLEAEDAAAGLPAAGGAPMPAPLPAQAPAAELATSSSPDR